MIVALAARRDAEPDIAALAERLTSALGGSDLGAHRAGWRGVIRSLALVAARADSPRVLEARVPHHLQQACLSAERPRSPVDVITYVTSVGRRPVVRPLPVASIVRTARHLQHAFEVSHRAHLTKPDRKRLEQVFHAALLQAKERARQVVRPALEE